MSFKQFAHTRGEVMFVNTNADALEKGDIPLGFVMALAQNEKALNHFASISNEERVALIAGSRGVSSKKEMQAYVDNMVYQTPSRQ